MNTLLIVDDESPFRRALSTTLSARGFEVIEAGSGHQALVAVADRRPDLVVLDLGLPDLDGNEVLERLRSFSEVPVVVLTARDQSSDVVAALEAGADDFVSKPFDSDELAARIKAALRRRPVRDDGAPLLCIGDLVIDLALRRVTEGGTQIMLTRTELALLEVFVTNPGRLLTHGLLLQRVWGPGYRSESNYLRTYVGQLRKKLGDEAARPRFILTEPGVGYRWIAEADEPRVAG